MNNFIFENSTKVFFGKGCVKEYLCCLTKAYGDTVMLCYGGGSIKKNGIYDEVTNRSAPRLLPPYLQIRLAKIQTVCNRGYGSFNRGQNRRRNRPCRY